MVKESDLVNINSWWTKRGNDDMDLDLLPSLGFIVEDKAAVFVYTTNSKLCFLENLINNPDNKDDNAINEVVQYAIEHIKSLGIKQIISYTSIPSVARKALDKGFILKQPLKYMFVNNLEPTVNDGSK